MSSAQPPNVAPQVTRREVMKRAAYVTPAILTLAAVPAFASGGSAAPKRQGRGHIPREQKKGLKVFDND